jgi:hypothetical protein
VDVRILHDVASIREQRRAAVSDEVHRLTGRLPMPVHSALAR